MQNAIKLIVIVIVLVVDIYLLLEMKNYRINLLESDDTEKLRKRGISKLQLKRYMIVHHLRSGLFSSQSCREIGLNSPSPKNSGMFNTIEEELKVLAFKDESTKFSHNVFSCPYSPENKERLQKIVSEYNESVKL